MSPEMREAARRRTPEEQRQFDVDALTKILEVHGIPRRLLERCTSCDAYKVRTEVCPMCGAAGFRAAEFRPSALASTSRPDLLAVETLEYEASIDLRGGG